MDKQTILIVDDLPANIRVLAEILGEEYEICVVTSGEEALQLVAVTPPHLILLDVVMPGLSGFQVCEQLQAKEETRLIPIVFITAHNDMESELQGLQLGAVDYIAKPFYPWVVKARVESHLALSRTMASLRALSLRNELILDTADDGILNLDEEGRVTYINRAGRRMLGWSNEALAGRLMQEAVYPHWCREGGGKESPFQLVYSLGQPYKNSDDELWKKDGSFLPVELFISPLVEKASNIGAVVIFHDITSRKEQEKRDLRSMASRLAISALYETSIEPLSMHRQLEVALDIVLNVPWLSLDHKGAIFLLDEASGQLQLTTWKNFTPSQVALCRTVAIGQCLCGMAAQKGEVIFAPHVNEMHTVTYEGISEHGHYCVPISNGSVLLGVLNLYIHHGHDPNAEYGIFLPVFCQALANLIMHRKLEAELGKVQKELEHAANHDRLTGLPNRRLLYELCGTFLTMAKRNNSQLGVMYIDLDRFKPINDTFGHEVGDLLLQSVALRLKGVLRDSDLVARIGGDEFIIVLQGIHHQNQLALVAEKILQDLNRPAQIGDIACSIGCSIGIALYPQHGETLDALLAKADQALYVVKEDGRNGFQIFQDSSHE
ncbi:MAG: diguanylate cyclase [Magnetococcales bacterium]|nr:diguanylate cyclase [Magnetococcales bacterium]NGZ26354.1 diguanylate cyclase [Magnetococcales bacterium]